MKINWKKLLPVIGITLVVALMGMLFTDTSNDWYLNLNKPSIQPPGWVFPIAWGIIYITAAASAYLVAISDGKAKQLILTVFGVNAALNVLWTYVFFQLHNPVSALVNIVLLLFTVILLIIMTRKVRTAASLLLLPYLFWLALATAINYCIVMLN